MKNVRISIITNDDDFNRITKKYLTKTHSFLVFYFGIYVADLKRQIILKSSTMGKRAKSMIRRLEYIIYWTCMEKENHMI